MISNRSPQSIFYTLSISAITALLLTSCGGGSSSSTSTVETAAVSEISGTLKEADGTVISAAAVDLDDLTTAKVLSALSTTTDTDGKYTVQPPNTGDFQLVFTKDGFATQYKPVTVSSSGASVTPTVMSKVDVTETIDNTTGGSVSSAVDTGGNIEIAVPANAAGEAITVSLTLLTGVEIPSTLPTTTGKTLLPVGALSMSISPSTVTALTSAATATVPVPRVLQDTGRTFTAYALENGVWVVHKAGLTNTTANTVTFDITTAGTYMVMTEIADITTDNASTTNAVIQDAVTVAAGSTVETPVTNTVDITIPNTVTDADAKAEIEALIKSLLEQQNGTQFGVPQTNIVEVSSVATKQSVAAKLVCTSTTIVTTMTTIFNLDLSAFGLGTIAVSATTIITTTTVSCADDGTGLSTGGTGGTG